MRLVRLTLVSLLAAATLLSGCDGNDPSGPADVAPDGYLYVANQADNTIFVYETPGLMRVDSFPAMVNQPHCLELSHDGEYLYVVGRTSPGQFAKFSLMDNSFVDSAIAGDDLFPTMIMVSMDGSTGYLCDFTDPTKPGKIHRYNLATMTFVDSVIAAGSATHDLRMTSDGKVMLAANFGTDNITFVYTEDDTVAFVDVDPDNPAPPGSPRCGPYGLAIDHNDSLAYIACRLSHEVRVLDLATRQIIDSIPIPVQGSSSLHGPTLMAISPDDRTLYVTTQLENTVAVVDLISRTVMSEIELGVSRPFGICIDRSGTRCYVACVNSENPAQDRTGRIYVIDGVSQALVDSVDAGNNSYGLIWRPAEGSPHGGH